MVVMSKASINSEGFLSDNEALYDISFRTLKLTTPTYGATTISSARR